MSSPLGNCYVDPDERAYWSLDRGVLYYQTGRHSGYITRYEPRTDPAGAVYWGQDPDRKTASKKEADLLIWSSGAVPQAVSTLSPSPVTKEVKGNG